MTVRRWRTQDAQALNDAVAASREHLLPWMPWAGEPPMTLAQRLRQLADWEREWRAGGDCVYGIFVGDQVAGGCGLHRRLGPAGLEIGYWLAMGFTGRGVITVAAGLLTDAAFDVPGLELVEIHHDKANERSGAVPRRLGYTLVRELA
ncbi:MAG: GNAT family N-acetyltransferase, partial [Acidobacteriota bacterium]|nr:GNAT family N-acetyltransferase [Acidobacteriota bacterium]